MYKFALELTATPSVFQEMLFNLLQIRWHNFIDFTHTYQSTATILYAWWHIREELMEYNLETVGKEQESRANQPSPSIFPRPQI
jgi:hypothetical protein